MRFLFADLIAWQITCTSTSAGFRASACGARVTIDLRNVCTIKEFCAVKIEYIACTWLSWCVAWAWLVIISRETRASRGFSLVAHRKNRSKSLFFKPAITTHWIVTIPSLVLVPSKNDKMVSVDSSLLCVVNKDSNDRTVQQQTLSRRQRKWGWKMGFNVVGSRATCYSFIRSKSG
jgi:hypothetical protein